MRNKTKLILGLILSVILFFFSVRTVDAGCVFQNNFTWNCDYGCSIFNTYEKDGKIWNCWSKYIGDGMVCQHWDCPAGGQPSGCGGGPPSLPPKCGVEIQPQVKDPPKRTFGEVAACGIVGDWNEKLPSFSVTPGKIYEIKSHATEWSNIVKRQPYCPKKGWYWETCDAPYYRVDTDRGVKPDVNYAGGCGDDPGVVTTRTYLATKNTMTITVGCHEIRDDPDNCQTSGATIDWIEVREISGADSAPSSNVNLRVGYWEDEGFGLIKIQRPDGTWPDWSSFKHNETGQTFSATLSPSGSINVQVMDYKDLESKVCSDTIDVQGISGYVWKDEDGNGRTGSDEDRYTKGDFTLVLRKSTGEVARTTPSTVDGSFSFPADTGQYRIEIFFPVVTSSDWTGTRWRLTIPDLRADKDVSLYGILNNLRLYTKADESDNWLGLNRDYPIRVLKDQTTNAWFGFWSAGEITGQVYQNPEGVCSGTQDPPPGWSLTCSNPVIGGQQTAEQVSASRYRCQRCWQNNCLTQLPRNQTYIIDLVPPLDWQVATGLGCQQDPTSIILDSASKTVTPPFYLWQGQEAWFQTQEGDVHAQGSISSKIPSTASPSQRYFSLAGLGGYPGVVSYGSGTPDFDQGSVSAPPAEWLAKSSFLSSYTYDVLYQKLDSPTTPFNCGMSPADFNNPAKLPSGFYWVNGDCSMGQSAALSVGTRKLVIFVNGNLGFTSSFKRLSVDSGGFFAFIVKGNINISGNVGDKLASTTPHLQGVYIADGVIDTYEPSPVGAGSGFRLVGSGLFYGRSGFNLKRDLKDDCTGICNSNTPAELFIFRPDLVLNAPSELWVSKMSWQELAP